MSSHSTLPRSSVIFCSSAWVTVSIWQDIFLFTNRVQQGEATIFHFQTSRYFPALLITESDIM